MIRSKSLPSFTGASADMFVKACGIRTKEQVDWAIELGYSSVGVVLHPGSVRFCQDKEAKNIALYARGRIKSVAVAEKYEHVKGVEDYFDYIQVYERVVSDKLIYGGDSLPHGLNFRFFLYDTSRGSGVSESLPQWLGVIRERLIIAGGLKPENVGVVIKKYRPFGVDVSSGVESVRGEKDYNLMKKFINEVKNGVS